MLRKAQAVAEICMLLGLALLGCVVFLPLFCIQQALMGNPLWFHPKYDKARR